MEFSGCGFKSHSGQLSIATSKNPSIPYMNTIHIQIYKKPSEGVRVKQHQYHILEIIDKYISKSLISSSVPYAK